MWLPDPRWESGDLMTGRKPTGPVVIDPSNGLSRDLVLYYGQQFGGGNDLTGNYPSTLVGDARPVAGDWAFDGAGDYLNLGSMGDFGSRLGSRSTTIISKLKVGTTSTMALCGTGNPGNKTVFQVALNRDYITGANTEGRIYARIRDEFDRKRTVEAKFNTGISDGNYHTLVIIMHPNAGGQIWLDGVELLVSQDDTDNVDNTGTFVETFDIGSLNWKGSHGTDGYFNGSISTFAIWERGLLSREIKSLYANPYQMLVPA